MKVWFLTIATILSCSVFYGGEAEKIQTLSSKVSLENSNGYFVLSDRSCWKVIPFTKRWRGPIEWWNGVQLVPENYECVPNDWYLGTQIEVYSKYENLEVDSSNASNEKDLKQCTHLFVNTRTGQVLFATALEPADCILQLFNDAHKEGYEKGYHEGRVKSYQNDRDTYDEGYSQGYKQGYKAGVKGE